MSQTQPIIAFPKLNPIRIFEATTQRAFCNDVPNYYTQKKYDCIWDIGRDEFAFQIKIENGSGWDNFHTITCQLIDISGTAYSCFTQTTVTQLFPSEGYDCDVYDLRTLFTVGGVSIPTGAYQLKLVVKVDFIDSGPFPPPPAVTLEEITFYSEPMYIMNSATRNDLFENTVYIKYSHENNTKGMVFIDPEDSSVRYYYIRVDGGFDIIGQQLASVDTVFTDQENDITLLESIPYEVKKLIIGGTQGIPNWQAEIINRIFCLTSTNIRKFTANYDDYGKDYVKKEGAKMESISVMPYPLIGWSIELVEAETMYDFETPTLGMRLLEDGTMRETEDGTIRIIE